MRRTSLETIVFVVLLASMFLVGHQAATPVYATSKMPRNRSDGLDPSR